MTEQGLRSLVLELASRYIGCKTGDTTERIIIDTYNSYFAGHYPRGYKLQYTDPWCQPFVESIAIMANLIDIFPQECGCGEAVNIARTMGIWHDASYSPLPGDQIMYDWNSKDDGWADHTGFVEVVGDNYAQTIEGNATGGVCARRTVLKSDTQILGYITPDYKSKATPEPAPSEFPWDGIVQTAVNLRTSPKNLGIFNYCNIEAPEGTPIRHVLVKGEKVKVIGEQGNWWQVEIHGRYTWTPFCAKKDGTTDIIVKA